MTVQTLLRSLFCFWFFGFFSSDIGRAAWLQEVLTVTPGKLPNFEENTKKFFMEHLHDHEEIRFILDGVGGLLLFMFPSGTVASCNPQNYI